MNDRDQRRFDRAVSVQTFGRNHQADFAPESRAAAHFKSLDSILADLIRARVGQRRASVSKTSLLDALSTDSKNIARTARAIEQKEPNFAAPYRIPNSPSETMIATHADALLILLEDNNAPVSEKGDSPQQKTAKAALRAKFISFELPAGFVEDLRADREALRQSNQANDTGNQEGVENTQLISTLLGLAQVEITSLDAIMHNKYTRDAPKMRAWTSASHVERAAHREKKPAAPAIPPPAAAA